MEAAAGLALQSRAAGFGSGSGRRRGAMYDAERSSRITSFRVGDQVASPAALRARGSKPVAPLRAKKSSGGK
jgi:shikimate kinase